MIPDPRTRFEKWIVRLVWLVGVGLTPASFLLLKLNLSEVYRRELDPGVYIGFLWAVSYLTVGAIILHAKPRHRVGLVLIGMGAVAALYAFAEQYSVYGLVVVWPTVLPGVRLMGWFQLWGLYLVFPAGIALPYLIFPDGRLPSQRWRPVLWLILLLSTMLVFEPLFRPGPVRVDIYRPAVYLRMTNPTGSQWITNIVNSLAYAWILGVLIVPLAILAPISRFRRARGLERQQLKWLAYSGIVIVILTPLLFISSFLSLDSEVLSILYLALMILILPATAAVAIVRHGLYDIDLLINRTLVYGSLTLLLGLLYFGSVTALQGLFGSLTGQQSSFTIVVSTLIIAVLFQPARRRLQTGIDRRFYRQRYDAERILSGFGLSLRAGVDQEALAASLLETVTLALHPVHVSLWMLDPEISGRPRGNPNQLNG